MKRTGIRESIPQTPTRTAVILPRGGPESLPATPARIPGDIRLLQDELQRYKTLLEKERDRNQLITTVIETCVAALPPAKPFPNVIRKQKEAPHVVMCDISDVHVGSAVDPKVTGGLSRYDFQTFLDRGERLRRSLLRILDIHRRVYDVPELYLNLLGDIVEGEGIFRGQPFQIDRALTDQVLEATQWFGHFIRDLAGQFRSIHIRCVGGNHGRGYEQGQSHPRTNWDVFVYKTLQHLLRDQKTVEFYVSDTSYVAYHLPGHERYRHVLIHGDQARAWAGIPFYGVERAGARIQSMLGIPVDYVHLGHHHNEAAWPSNRMEYLMNGSWVGGSDLSVNRLFRTSRATQNLFFLHPRRGLVANYRLHLNDWEEVAADERGVYATRP